MTAAEQALWRLLRGDQLRGFRYRRQAAIGAYFVDFVCFSRKLVVELDGPQHSEEAVREHDAERTEWLSTQGYRLLRFWNHQLDNQVQLVLEAILRALEVEEPAIAPPLSPALSTRERGSEGEW
jgi:very-short-patch-repair endonuclease